MHTSFRRILLLFVLILLARNAFAQRSIITTAAGTGTAGFAGDGGAATAAALNGPIDVAVDAAGNFYIADRANQRVRKVSRTGVITTVAGNGIAGFSGDGGPATSASLNTPSGVAVDSAGNMYIADFENGRIRKVNTAGIISTVDIFQFYPTTNSPTPEDPFWNDVDARLRIRYYSNGFAIPIKLIGPVGVAVDAAGNVYVAEQGGQRIRKVDHQTDFVSTIAGTGTAGYSGDGGPGASAQINNPAHLVLDSAGNVYFADSSNNRIRRISAGSGVITTVAASLNTPRGIAVDAGGNLFVADTLNKRVLRVAASGAITTIAGGGSNGDGCAAATSSLQFPQSMAVNLSGTLIYIAEELGNRIRLVTVGATAAAPTLTSIAPENGAAGQGHFVTLTGTRFAACGVDATKVSVGGSGITVTNVNVISDTAVSATFTIARDAALGARNVTVTTEDGTSGAIKFTVTPPGPTLTAITPPNGVRGTSVTVTLAGADFSTQPDTMTVFAGDSVEIAEVRVESATSMTVVLNILGDASLGKHNVTVTTPTGTSNAIPFTVQPESPTFVYAMPQTLKPTENTPIQVSLANPHADAVTGRLTMTFVPNAATDRDDPNVMFINHQSNARATGVTFSANALTAELSLPSGLLQAGTVAGTIRLSMTDVQVGGVDAAPVSGEFEIQIPRMAPVIANVRIVNRTSSGFDVEVTGYSTTREITTATFAFGAASGAKLLTLQLRPDVSGSFTSYYQSDSSVPAGSAFVYLQPFIIQQGDVNAVASVTVSLANTVGTSETKTAR